MRLDSLKDGTNVALRPLVGDDLEAALQFFRGLPASDRRYLRYDVSRASVVARLIREAEEGHAYRVAAWVDDTIVGHGALELRNDSWHRHTGEIRMLVADKYRGKRLGSLLALRLFEEAKGRGVEKVIAKMVPEQTNARAVLERLGFHLDAVLDDYVKDQAGELHPIMVMSCSLDAVTREMRDAVKKDDWPDG